MSMKMMNAAYLVDGEGRNERWQELKNGMKCMERRHRTKE